MYKLILGKHEYITQTHRKYFKIALNYCLENKCDSCRVNRTYFNFDFKNLEVDIKSIGNSYWSIYKMEVVK